MNRVLVVSVFADVGASPPLCNSHGLPRHAQVHADADRRHETRLPVVIGNTINSDRIDITID